MKPARLLAVACLIAAMPVQAQMYKCKDARGVTQYADKPCPEGKGQEVDIRGQPPISGKLTPYKENLSASERDFQRRQTQQERERQNELRTREAKQRMCSARQSELERAMAVRRPADAGSHDARIARLQAEVSQACR